MLTALLAAGTAAAPAQGLRPEQVSALSPSSPPSGAERPYVDRVLESGPQQGESADTDEGYNAQGWARSLRLEYSLNLTRGPAASRTHAVAVSGYVETPLYGTLSLLGTLVDSSADGAAPSAARESRTSTWRLDQRAMPLEGGWLANHSAGQTSTAVTPLARGLSRIYLPTTPIAGLGGEWLLRDDLDINASLGQPGLYSGRDISGFEARPGQLATVGGQARLLGSRNGPSRVDAALQVVQARDIESAGLAPGQQVSSAWGALAWEGPAPWGEGLRPGPSTDSVATRPGGARFQFSFLRSSEGPGSGAGGAWLDGTWRNELAQHTAGVFHLEPELRWGATTMPADLRGGYWRGDIATRRWQAGWSTEFSDSVSGRFGRSGFGNVYGRYLLDSRNAVDATLALRTGGDNSAESLQLNFDHGSDWGQTRWRGNVLRARDGHTSFVGVDHAWALTAPSVLSTSLGWQANNVPGTVSPILTWAILGSVSPLARLSFDASLHGAQGGRSNALFANIGASWQLAPEWTVAARYTEARGQDPQQVQVVSALTAATQAIASTPIASRSLQLALRYETRAGTLPVPLGGTRTSGAGSLSGTVFFDADRNGRREASENGAPNVTVVLDGRFVVRTDATGRFEFPSLVAGPHTLQVQTDNVPLPWAPASQDPVRTEVLVRGATVLDFALQRER